MHSIPKQKNKGTVSEAELAQMCDTLAQELTTQMVFPTCFDVAIRLQGIINDPRQTIDHIVSAISLEPLIAAKLLRLANSALYGGKRSSVKSVKPAVVRLGLTVVQHVAHAIAIKQLMMYKDMGIFQNKSRLLWEHSLKTAAAAYVIAKNLTDFSAEEAMFAGIVHDLGAFYLLYKIATERKEIHRQPNIVDMLIVREHEVVGCKLLSALNLPTDIILATANHDHIRDIPPIPKTMADVVYIANLIAGGTYEWRGREDKILAEEMREGMESSYRNLEGEIYERLGHLNSIFG